jgi:phage shock protein A
MGILDRLGRVIKANVNSVLDGAEDPEKVVGHTITEMESSVRQGRKELVSAMASEKMLAKKQEDSLKKARDWESKALLALKAGDEDLAREALRRKKKVEHEAEDFERQRIEAVSFVDELRGRIEAAEKKVEELKNAQGSISSKVRAARKQTTSEASGKSVAMDRFDNLASKFDEMDAEVEAARVLDDGPSEAELEQKFARLGQDDGLDDEFAALKQKLK